MTEKEHEEMMQILMDERERVRNVPGAGKALLISLGLWDILVPKGTNKENQSIS